MTAYGLGQLTAILAIPLLGLVLLVIGLNKRSKSKRPPPPPYPYPGYPPPGYPGYPPPVAPYGQYPPPPPPKSSAGTGFIIAGALLLAFGVLGFAGQVGRAALRAGDRSQTPERMSVGDCLTAAGIATRRMVQRPTDCSDPKAVYELASTGDGAANCPDGKRDTSLYSILTNDTTTLCFTLNMVEGRCYAETSPGSKIVDDVPCTTTDAGKVITRIDGSTDESRCTGDTSSIALPEPARVYCMGQP